MSVTDTSDDLDPWYVLSTVEYVTMIPVVQEVFRLWCYQLDEDLTWVVQVLVGDTWIAFDRAVVHPCGAVVTSAGVPHATRRVITNRPDLPPVVEWYFVKMAMEGDDG
jgi:hypothetical protein